MIGPLARVALTRPWLLPALFGLGWAVRRRDWYRRPPFLPLPPPDYLRWRMETAYGGQDVGPPAEELRRFLAWARRMRGRMR